MLNITDISLACSRTANPNPSANARKELRALLLRVVDRVEERETRVETVHMSDAREISSIARCAKDVRVTGLDSLLTQDYANAFKGLLSHSDDIEFCPGNGFGCASALAVEFVNCGGRKLVVSFLGLGGYAPLEETLLALRVTRRLKPGLDLTVLSKLRDAFERTGMARVGPRKAIVGRQIFRVESGIHVNGILKNASNYEPFPPETVGLRREVRLGKHSGKSAVAYKLRELGLAAAAADVDEILRLVREKSAELSRGVSDDEFKAIVEIRNRNGSQA
jgi:homocitrate synthase NifV